jgi:hypothetical protein
MMWMSVDGREQRNWMSEQLDDGWWQVKVLGHVN